MRPHARFAQAGLAPTKPASRRPSCSLATSPRHSAINVKTAVEATRVYGAPDAAEDAPFEPLGEIES